MKNSTFVSKARTLLVKPTSAELYPSKKAILQFIEDQLEHIRDQENFINRMSTEFNCIFAELNMKLRIDLRNRDDQYILYNLTLAALQGSTETIKDFRDGKLTPEKFYRQCRAESVTEKGTKASKKATATPTVTTDGKLTNADEKIRAMLETARKIPYVTYGFIGAQDSAQVLSEKHSRVVVKRYGHPIATIWFHNLPEGKVCRAGGEYFIHIDDAIAHVLNQYAIHHK